MELIRIRRLLTSKLLYAAKLTVGRLHLTLATLMADASAKRIFSIAFCTNRRVLSRSQRTIMLIIVSQDCDRIRTKINHIRNRLSMSRVHIFEMQETWLNSSISDEEITQDTNYIIRSLDSDQIRQIRDTKRKVGGGGITERMFAFRKLSWKKSLLLKFKLLSS